MSDLVDYKKHGAVGVITINNPPVNALSPGVPEGIYESLQQGMKDDGVKAMVLIGGGRSFIAGADIKHVGEKKSPIAMKWRDEMEMMDKPVVAAIHGFALGGGLERFRPGRSTRCRGGRPGPRIHCAGRPGEPCGPLASGRRLP